MNDYAKIQALLQFHYARGLMEYLGERVIKQKVFETCSACNRQITSGFTQNPICLDCHILDDKLLHKTLMSLTIDKEEEK